MIMMNECKNSTCNVLTILLVWSGPQFLIVRCSCDGVQIKDLILPCIFSVKDHRRQNVVKTKKVVHEEQHALTKYLCLLSSVTVLFVLQDEKKNGMLLMVTSSVGLSSNKSRKQLKCVYNSAYHIMCCQSFSHLKMLSTCTFPIYPIKKHHWGPFFFFWQWV